MQSQYVEYPNTPQQTAALDQAQTGLENLAKLIATYYATLRREGVPKPLAFSLVMDYHGLLLSRMEDGNG